MQSRLPSGEDLMFDKEEVISEITTEVHALEKQTVSDFPLSAKTVAKHTREARRLSRVLLYVADGWPAKWPPMKNDDENGRPYQNARNKFWQ